MIYLYTKIRRLKYNRWPSILHDNTQDLKIAE